MSLRDEIAAAASAMLAITDPHEPRRTENLVNDTTVRERMKSALLTVDVTAQERIVLLDIAASIDEDHLRECIFDLGSARASEFSLVSHGGHDSLALALGVRPETGEAERLLSDVLASLADKGFIRWWDYTYGLIVFGKSVFDWAPGARDEHTAQGAIS